MTATESTRLNANSRLRVALQGVFQEDALRRIAEQLAEIDQKNWSVGQWVRVVGANKQKGIEEITSEVKQAKFDVDIEIGTAMPFDQEKRKQDYVQAAEFIANPQYASFLPELLNEFEIANAEEVLARNQVYQQIVQMEPIMPYMKQILQLPQVAQYMAQVQAQQPQQGAA